jgi:hypothetical protein
MGQAKQRKQQLGDLYGTPEGSNRKFVAYQGFDQQELDRKSLRRIQAAMAAGEPVTLIGTEAARPLAQAAGLPWLHELPQGEPIPQSLAWDPQIAEDGGPLLPPGHGAGGVAILGAGAARWMGGPPAVVSPS